MTEKTWNMVYSAIMDLTKGVSELCAEMNSRFEKVNRRLEKIDANIELLKIKQFDNENEIWILKTRQALSANK